MSRIIMANLVVRNEFEAVEDKNLLWATEWVEVDVAIYAIARRAYLKLARIWRGRG